MIEELLQNPVGMLMLAAVVVAATALIFSRPRIPQAPSYHDFADRRTFFGVANFWDVISNVPFLLVGIWGLFAVTSSKFQTSQFARSESWPYIVFFLGLALTFLGSSYYHLNPTNVRLMWDRLPMTLGFMGILSATIAERISVNTGVWLLFPLVAIGVLSVGYWYWTETQGKGDLRPYYVVQFGSILSVLAVLVIFPPRYTRSWCLVLALILYAAAKVAEAFDSEIYKLTQAVSGHTLKHLSAAAAGFFVVLMLQGRTALKVGVKESRTPQSSLSSEMTSWTVKWSMQHPLKRMSNCQAPWSGPWHSALPEGDAVLTVKRAPEGAIGSKNDPERSC